MNFNFNDETVKDVAHELRYSYLDEWGW